MKKCFSLLLALVLALGLTTAALAAEGESLIVDSGHIARGYEHLDHKLRYLGADIFLEL